MLGIETGTQMASNLGAFCAYMSIQLFLGGTIFLWGRTLMYTFELARESPSSTHVAVLVVLMFSLPSLFIAVRPKFLEVVDQPKVFMTRASFYMCRYAYFSPMWAIWWVRMVLEASRTRYLWVEVLAVCMTGVSCLLVPSTVWNRVLWYCCRPLCHSPPEQRGFQHRLRYVYRRLTGSPLMGDETPLNGGDEENPVDYGELRWQRRGWIVMLRARAESGLPWDAGSETTQGVVEDVVKIVEPGLFAEVVRYL